MFQVELTLKVNLPRDKWRPQVDRVVAGWLVAFKLEITFDYFKTRDFFLADI